jgi:hypothetical protein
MGFEDEVERSFGRPCRSCRQIQADIRTHLIRRFRQCTEQPLRSNLRVKLKQRQRREIVLSKRGYY